MNHYLLCLLLILPFYTKSEPVEVRQKSNVKINKQDAIKTHNKSEDLGWNFYWEEEVEILDKKKAPKIAPPSSKPQKEKKKTFSTDWFKENFQIITNRAIDNPSRENIKALLFAERIMLDKSESFARKKAYYQSVIPELQEGTRLPMTGSAATSFRAFKSSQRQEAMKEIANHAGIVFFYDHNCAHCTTMVPLINRLYRENKQKVYVVAKNLKGNNINRLDSNIKIYADEGQSTTFKIKIWPAVVLLKPPLDVMIVAQGSLFYPELEKRIINIAFERNILNDDWFYRIYPEQKGLISTNQMAGVPDDINNDPVKLINYIADLAASPEGLNIDPSTDKKESSK